MAAVVVSGYVRSFAKAGKTRSWHFLCSFVANPAATVGLYCRGLKNYQYCRPVIIPHTAVASQTSHSLENDVSHDLCLHMFFQNETSSTP